MNKWFKPVYPLSQQEKRKAVISKINDKHAHEITIRGKSGFNNAIHNFLFQHRRLPIIYKTPLMINKDDILYVFKFYLNNHTLEELPEDLEHYEITLDRFHTNGNTNYYTLFRALESC